eukprot:Hpha_TRINITY_DN10586_c0_g1::TRINITY_DN10586_c0_g1_i2::g.31218::m.31218
MLPFWRASWSCTRSVPAGRRHSVRSGWPEGSWPRRRGSARLHSATSPPASRRPPTNRAPRGRVRCERPRNVLSSLPSPCPRRGCFLVSSVLQGELAEEKRKVEMTRFKMQKEKERYRAELAAAREAVRKLEEAGEAERQAEAGTRCRMEGELEECRQEVQLARGAEEESRREVALTEQRLSELHRNEVQALESSHSHTVLQLGSAAAEAARAYLAAEEAGARERAEGEWYLVVQSLGMELRSAGGAVVLREVLNKERTIARQAVADTREAEASRDAHQKAARRAEERVTSLEAEVRELQSQLAERTETARVERERRFEAEGRAGESEHALRLKEATLERSREEGAAREQQLQAELRGAAEQQGETSALLVKAESRCAELERELRLKAEEGATREQSLEAELRSAASRHGELLAKADARCAELGQELRTAEAARQQATLEAGEGQLRLERQVAQLRHEGLLDADRAQRTTTLLAAELGEARCELGCAQEGWSRAQCEREEGERRVALTLGLATEAGEARARRAAEAMGLRAARIGALENELEQAYEALEEARGDASCLTASRERRGVELEALALDHVSLEEAGQRWKLAFESAMTVMLLYAHCHSRTRVVAADDLAAFQRRLRSLPHPTAVLAAGEEVGRRYTRESEASLFRRITGLRAAVQANTLAGVVQRVVVREPAERAGMVGHEAAVWRSEIMSPFLRGLVDIRVAIQKRHRVHAYLGLEVSDGTVDSDGRRTFPPDCHRDIANSAMGSRGVLLRRIIQGGPVDTLIKKGGLKPMPKAHDLIISVRSMDHKWKGPRRINTADEFSMAVADLHPDYAVTLVFLATQARTRVTAKKEYSIVFHPTKRAFDGTADFGPARRTNINHATGTRSVSPPPVKPPLPCPTSVDALPDLPLRLPSYGDGSVEFLDNAGDIVIGGPDAVHSVQMRSGYSSRSPRVPPPPGPAPSADWVLQNSA